MLYGCMLSGRTGYHIADENCGKKYAHKTVNRMSYIYHGHKHSTVFYDPVHITLLQRNHFTTLKQIVCQ